MICFVQTYDQRISITGVFEVSWLVDNNTAYDNKTPRHMPCLQQEFKEGGKKDFINYFSDLIFEKPDNEGVLPVALPVMTLLVFENNNEQMVGMFSEAWIQATKKYNKIRRVLKESLFFIL